MIPRTLPRTRVPLRRLLNPQPPLRSSYTEGISNSSLPPLSTETRQGWLFVDSVFPIQIARWDLRHYVGLFREEYLLDTLRRRLDSVKTHDFHVLSIQPYHKDGGVFVHFSYSSIDSDNALETVESRLAQEAAQHGGPPSWLGLTGGNIWLVKGSPWKEDMNRYASPIIKVTFEGSDVHEQSLYRLFRNYGRIQDLTQPNPVPAGSLRSIKITFNSLRSATIARNVIHGLRVSSSKNVGPDANNISLTRLRTTYERPVQAHAIRDWISSHPKIMLPLLVFLLGTVTYTIFDPVRSLMVQGKIMDWFDYREFRLYKWLHINTLDRFYLAFRTPDAQPPSFQDIWKERGEAVGAVKSYLSDVPSTVAFIHGPQGSGKTRMLEAVLEESDRKTLVIDCRALQKASSDSQMISALANQTGYWPIFTFLNSVNNLIDLASMGLIGQKSGLSSSLNDQLQQILAIVGTALKGVSSSHLATIKRQTRNREREEKLKDAETKQRDKIRRGIWHDGRLDCVAGNGIMCELGIGDELMLEDDEMNLFSSEGEAEKWGGGDGDSVRKQKSMEEMGALGALPVVLIRNFAVKVGSNREELLTLFAQWAATLAENQLAHVIVVSDNRENSKYLAKALQSKPLVSIALSDADSRSSVSFVKQKLKDADFQANFTSEQMAYIERFGGRASDLESLIHKVRNGQQVEEAVEDIIIRGVEELRKNAFGDDADDAKSLPWTREQVWTVFKMLSKREEIPYYEVLLDLPFKGDETSLRSMEHAEFITIGTHEGRASTIRPGKPILRWVFERLVNDQIFQASQEIRVNDQAIMSAEKTVANCEEELKTLRIIAPFEARPWWHFGTQSAVSLRARQVSDKMLSSTKKIEALERKNAELKRRLVNSEKRET